MLYEVITGREAVQGQGDRSQDHERFRKDEDQGAHRRKATFLEEGPRGAEAGRQDRVFRRRVTSEQARSARHGNQKIQADLPRRKDQDGPNERGAHKEEAGEDPRRVV